MWNSSLRECFECWARTQAKYVLSPHLLRDATAHAACKFTYQGTNTYIVGTGTQRLIIDTSGGEPAWAKLLSATLESHGIALSHVLLTHWHGDHTGGVPDLRRLYPHLSTEIYKNEPEEGQRNISDGQLFDVEGATVRALHVPGHSDDHMCFILEEEQAMFTGDNVLGHGTSATEDLKTFTDSLQRMADQDCVVGYSAHGVVIDDLRAKIGGELGQKLRREKQVMQALERIRVRGIKSACVDDIVTEIYGSTLDEKTRTLALKPFMGEVLKKLAADGSVAFENRGGKKKWFALGTVKRSLGRAKTTGMVVKVQAIAT